MKIELAIEEVARLIELIDRAKHNNDDNNDAHVLLSEIQKQFAEATS